MSLIERIDKALHERGMNRAQLAKAIGITPQTFSNLAKRPTATLKPENLAKAAHVLHCDLEWLLTGKDGVPQEYKPAENNNIPHLAVAERKHHTPPVRLSPIAEAAARLVGGMSPSDQERALMWILRMSDGHWPRDVDGHRAK